MSRRVVRRVKRAKERFTSFDRAVEAGENSGGGPPGPMPNPEVKPSSADGTAICFAGE